MLTTSELAVTVTIWALTAAGGFFGTRARLRKKKLKCEEIKIGEQAGRALEKADVHR